MEYDQAQNDIFVGISARLKSERQRLGLNQDEFARLGLVSTQTQTRYETGLFLPKLEYLQALSGHGVDAVFVLCGQQASYVLQPQDRTLLEGFNQLQEAQKSVVLALVETILGKSPDLTSFAAPDLQKPTLHDKSVPYRAEPGNFSDD